MMSIARALSVPLFLALAACAPGASVPPGADPMPDVPILPSVADDTCNANNFAAQIGQPATSLERVLILGPVRVIRPDTMVTMDFSEGRINFGVDASDRIVRIYCG